MIRVLSILLLALIAGTMVALLLHAGSVKVKAKRRFSRKMILRVMVFLCGMVAISLLAAWLSLNDGQAPDSAYAPAIYDGEMIRPGRLYDKHGD